MGLTARRCTDGAHLRYHEQGSGILEAGDDDRDHVATGSDWEGLNGTVRGQSGNAMAMRWECDGPGDGRLLEFETSPATTRTRTRQDSTVL